MQIHFSVRKEHEAVAIQTAPAPHLAVKTDLECCLLLAERWWLDVDFGRFICWAAIYM